MKSVFCLIHLETMYRVLTFDVTTAMWQALSYLVVTRESMEAFTVGGMRMAFKAELAVENKNPEWRRRCNQGLHQHDKRPGE